MRPDEKKARELFESELHTIQRVIRTTCRNRRLGPQESEDFESYVMLKFIENNYRRLRRFKGESSLATFLTTVVQRLFLDSIISKWGKWRPSVRARGLGDLAVQLERLMDRDGLTFDEARAILESCHEGGLDEEELRALAGKLPVRRRRPREVSLDLLEQLPGDEQEDPVREIEVSGNACVVASKLASVIERLSEEDRLLLKLRFFSRLTARRIGVMLDRTPSQVYTRIDSILSQLRKELELKGVQTADVKAVLEWGQFDMDLGSALGD